MRQSVIALLAVLALVSCSTETPTPTNPQTSNNNPPTPPTTTLQPNRPPTVTISDQSPKGTILAGGTQVAFNATATDPDNDSLTFDWDFGDGEKATVKGGGIGHVFYREGTLTVTVTATDSRGGTARAETTVTTRKLTGAWRVENARHTNVSATITQGNASGFAFNMTDGATGNGQVQDPYVVIMNITAGNDYCIPSGSYRGTVNPAVDAIDFPYSGGSGCTKFSMFRK